MKWKWVERRGREKGREIGLCLLYRPLFDQKANASGASKQRESFSWRRGEGGSVIIVVVEWE